MHFRLTLSCLLVAALTPAQTPTHISPVAAASGTGNSNNAIPFSWTPTAYQQVHSANSFHNTSPTLVSRMRLRMATPNRTGQTIDVELFMSASPNDAASASSTFANNVTGTEVNVFTRKMVLLPTVPDNSWAVAPFPFDNPFPFIATHLSWRAIVWGNSNNNQIFSYPLDAWQNASASAATPIGTGCRAANGSAAATQSVTGLGLGTTAAYGGSSFVAAGGVPALLAIGTSATTFQGIPLPFDLTPAGAPGCSIYNNWLAVFATVTSPGPTGPATVNVPIPNDQALANTTHYSQFLFVSPAANALGVFTSTGSANRIGGPIGITRIYASGNPGATGGTVGVQYGMAIGLN
jgi:hypothetical protein